MNPVTIFFVIATAAIYSVHGQGLVGSITAKCPDEKVLTQTFGGMYSKFRSQVCKPCDKKVGESAKSQKWISDNVFNQILSAKFLGVDPPANCKSKTSVIAECAKAKAEGDFCGKPQQDAFMKCLDQNKGKFADCAPFGVANCKKIQDHMKSKAQEIESDLTKIGKSYVDAKCGEA